MATKEERNIKKEWEEYQSAKVAQEDRQKQVAPESDASLIDGGMKTVVGGAVVYFMGKPILVEFSDEFKTTKEYQKFRKELEAKNTARRVAALEADELAESYTKLANKAKQMSEALDDAITARELVEKELSTANGNVKNLESKIQNIQDVEKNLKLYEERANSAKTKTYAHASDLLETEDAAKKLSEQLKKNKGVKTVEVKQLKKGWKVSYKVTPEYYKTQLKAFEDLKTAREVVGEKIQAFENAKKGVSEATKNLQASEKPLAEAGAKLRKANGAFTTACKELDDCINAKPKGVGIKEVETPKMIEYEAMKPVKPKIGVKGYAGRGLRVLGAGAGLALGYWGVSEMAKASIDSFNAAFHPNGASRSEAVDDKSKAASGTLSPEEQKYFSNSEYLDKCFSVLVYASKNGLAGISKEEWSKYQQEFMTASDPKQIGLRKALVAEYDANKAKYKAVAAEHDKQAKKADITTTQVAKGLHVLQYLAENGGAIKGGKYVKQGLPVEQYQTILEQIKDGTANPVEVANLLKLLAEGYDNKANGFIRDWEPSKAQEGDGVSVKTKEKTPEAEKDNSKEKPEAESEYIEGDLDNLDDILGFSTQNTPANTSRALRGAGSEVREDNGPQVRSRSSGRGGMA